VAHTTVSDPGAVRARQGRLRAVDLDSAGLLSCGFSYQAAQVLVEDVHCAICASPAGDPDLDAVIITKISDGLGSHFYLRGACADSDLAQRDGLAGDEVDRGVGRGWGGGR